MTLYKTTYESFGAAIVGAESPAKAVFEDRSSRRDKNPEWYGSTSFDAGMSLARHGWQEGREKMAKAVGVAAMSAGFSRSPAFDLDMAGAYPIAALAAAGNPMCMVSPSPVNERARPIVKITVSASVSAMTDSNDIFNYGAALLAFVDGLEQADIRTELHICYACRAMNGKDLGSFLIKFKKAEEALDLDKAAFILASPAMFRRLVFSLYEMNFPKQFENGYGIPRDPVAGDDYDADSILLPSCQSFRNSLGSPAKAFAAIAPTIEGLLRDRHHDFPPISFEAR